MFKKVLFTFAMLVCCTMCFSQECIYELPQKHGCKGEICVIDDEFYLFGMTDQKSMASIYLGKGVDNAIYTLQWLQGLSKEEKGEFLIEGCNSDTKVMHFKFNGMGCTFFSTEGVKGQCCLLCGRFDYDMAIMAVGEYLPDLPPMK